MQIISFLQFSAHLMFLFLLRTTADGYFTPVYSNTSLSQAAQIAQPNCPSKCGNITVPYPFGVGVNATCSINPVFDVNCDDSFNPPKAFILNKTFEVLAILDTKIRIRNQLAWSCFNEKGNSTKYRDFSMDLSQTPFSFSNENKLTLVGCDDFGFTSRRRHRFENLISTCMATCSDPQDLSNDSCSGIGCCQASIPKGLQFIFAALGGIKNHAEVHDFNPCGYLFLAEKNRYSFNVSDISDSSFVNRTVETVPLLIDWAIGNGTCDEIRSSGEIICHGESVCVDSGRTVGGHRCNCSPGYRGNPYLSPGCQDVNECESSPCHPEAICTNLPGSFNCSCLPNYLGDGTTNGTGCIPLPPPRKTALYAGLLAGFGLFLVMAISFWSYKKLKKRRSNQLKQAFFKRNGGLLLQQQISAHDSILDKMKVFTSKELEKATDKFNESRILGRGGQGTVYKGMLTDGRIVAVKKSKQVDEAQVVEFINEVVILSQINHRNVVKLLGCCLETEVPLLVYEFIPNGTLYELIHDNTTGFPFSWDLRLRIAAEIANALAYLHYATSIPIYHRDMKSSNILLDEKYRAKLSDFGISRSVAIDQTHLTTKVKGTFGYFDPEYFQTGKFTEKSDVYSFGVVLVELLTGEKPISTSVTEEDDEERSLITRFLMTMKENHLKPIIDPRIVEQDIKEEHLTVAKLAKRCLNLNGRKRPTIREVAMELESVGTRDNPSSIESKIQDLSYSETESLSLNGAETGDGSSWMSPCLRQL